MALALWAILDLIAILFNGKPKATVPPFALTTTSCWQVGAQKTVAFGLPLNDLAAEQGKNSRLRLAVKQALNSKRNVSSVFVRFAFLLACGDPVGKLLECATKV